MPEADEPASKLRTAETPQTGSASFIPASPDFESQPGIGCQSLHLHWRVRGTMRAFGAEASAMAGEVVHHHQRADSSSAPTAAKMFKKLFVSTCIFNRRFGGRLET